MDSGSYTASSTNLNSAVFDEGWQQKYDITYKDLQWAETGERLTPESFARYRQQGGLVVIHQIPEAAVRAAVADPGIMIASDGLPITGPPRSSSPAPRVAANQTATGGFSAAIVTGRSRSVAAQRGT